MTFLHKNKSMNKNRIFRIKANQEVMVMKTSFLVGAQLLLLKNEWLLTQAHVERHRSG